jgi:hypothetical protein
MPTIQSDEVALLPAALERSEEMTKLACFLGILAFLAHSFRTL